MARGQTAGGDHLRAGCDVAMMISNWIAVCRGFLSMPLGVIAFATFVLVAVAVIARRVTSSIQGSLALAGVFTLAFLLMSLTIEHRSEPQAIWLLTAVFVGVGRASYLRLVSAPRMG